MVQEGVVGTTPSALSGDRRNDCKASLTLAACVWFLGVFVSNVPSWCFPSAKKAEWWDQGFAYQRGGLHSTELHGYGAGLLGAYTINLS